MIGGISIEICVEPNKADKELLQRLQYFENTEVQNMRSNEENSRVLIEEKIPFTTPDNEIVEKLQAILRSFKISEKYKTPEFACR